MSDTTTVGLRISNELRDRIDQHAALHGQSRTAYILSWLPINYDSSAETKQHKGQQRQRVVRSQQQSSPAHD